MAKGSGEREGSEDGGGQSLATKSGEVCRLPVDVDAVDSNGRTALFVAVEKCHVRVVNVLVAQADIHFARETDGQTPLMASCQQVPSLPVSACLFIPLFLFLCIIDVFQVILLTIFVMRAKLV